MSKGFIFVSCGQYTEEEKRLGKSISKMVKTITGLDAFFAEDVRDLNGLDSNILGALRDAVAFITVMHPRGAIIRPNGETHVRASVWIEQEIAIATYIQRVEKRPLPVIAFIHESVGREGLRDLVHLNPQRFLHETEVLAALPELLEPWKELKPTGLRVEMHSAGPILKDGHPVRHLVVNLINETNDSITKLSGALRLPAGVLKHWTAAYMGEERSDDPHYRLFRFNEEGGRGPIPPHSTKLLISYDYCTRCAAEQSGEVPAIAAALVGESEVQVRVWIEGKEYHTLRTIKELSS